MRPTWSRRVGATNRGSGASTRTSESAVSARSTSTVGAGSATSVAAPVASGDDRYAATNEQTRASKCGLRIIQNSSARPKKHHTHLSSHADAIAEKEAVGAIVLNSPEMASGY